MSDKSSNEYELVEIYLEKLRHLDVQNISVMKEQKEKFKIINQLIDLLFKYKYSKDMYENISSLIYLFLNFYTDKYPIDTFSPDNVCSKAKMKKYKEILKSEITEEKS